MKQLYPNLTIKKAVFVILLFITLQNGLAQEINWYSIDSGGGVATANEIEMVGVLGQTDTQQMSNGDITLAGGYLPIRPDNDLIFKTGFD
jgi:hypothetical protein